MKKQNGFGLIALLISIAIIAYIFIVASPNSKVETDDSSFVDGVGSINVEKKSILENQLNSIKKAEEAKKVLEERNTDLMNIENY